MIPDGNMVQDAYLATLVDDVDVSSAFPGGYHATQILPHGITLEDPGLISEAEEYVLCSTVVGEGTTDETSGAAVPFGGQRSFGGTQTTVFVLGLIVYVYDRRRSPDKKRQLVQLTGAVKRAVGRYRQHTEPLTNVQLFYHTRFRPPMATSYRKFENHQQSITLVEVFSRGRVTDG